jgi:hypothetical protein
MAKVGPHSNSRIKIHEKYGVKLDQGTPLFKIRDEGNIHVRESAKVKNQNQN